MYELPTSINSYGQEFKIRCNGDFRMVLDCLEALDDEDIKPIERLYSALIIFYSDLNTVDNILALGKDQVQDLLSQMFKFFNLNEEDDKNSPHKPKLVDWKADSTLVISAINNVAGKEIRLEEFVHWWTFIGYYMSIGECALSTVISIRSKIAHNEKLEKYEKKFRAENPKYFTVDLRTHEQKANDEWAKSVWNSGR